jgi:hypothetical protein
MIAKIKQGLKSRTVRAGILTTIIGALGFLAADEFISGYPGTVALLIAAKGIFDVILRYDTTRPVREK